MLQLFDSPANFLSKREVQSGSDPQLFKRVRRIIERVRQQGDVALRYFTEKYDGVRLDNLKVPAAEIERARTGLSEETNEILLEAIANVRDFHEKQLPKSWTKEGEDGSLLGMRFTPIKNVGCYIPGGSAGYPSTAIMTAVPAQIAGVKRIVLVSRPISEGLANSLVMAVASLLGINEIYTLGGAQAIAALAFGTESVPKVDKIVGPGNAFVNEAKRQLFGTVGIDTLAGPTELVILADEFAPVEYVVRDLFAQAEHDAEARVILVTTSKQLADAVRMKADELLAKTERREILEKSLRKHGAVVIVADLREGAQLVNQIAPEHVQIITQNPEAILSQIENAGAICLGDLTPVVVGDYFAGPNHVLPTGKSATFASPLSVSDFLKFSSIIRYSRARFEQDGSKIAQFAELEGLDNHKNAITCRYE